ncbi:cilia- and flagella-associated protein 57 [Tribolium madens]|uniref:cilia- and flagella-associated protein 57 n=1 Tax=Tribolium madens TaxID=41895 RepID=UPI001CF73BF0|nr:cilia- and flagella-associated protein 57 [Tribolium madens]
MSTLPILQPRLILGLRTDVKGNAQFITDEEIIYPVGAVLTIHNLNQKRQKYIKLADKGKNVTEIVVSPNKKLVAVVETGEKPFITLWCPLTYKKKRQINLPTDKETLSERFTAVAFTFDSKYLVCVSGEPDWTLYYFRCDKGKLESSARANNISNTGYVRQIACNPNDANLLALVGDGLIRILACTDYTWRQYGYSKGDQWNFTSAVWLTQDRLLVGTLDGRLLVIESGELKFVFSAADLAVMDLKPKDELQQSSQTSLKVLSDDLIDSKEDYSIRSLIQFPRGFAFGYLTGTVHLYEMETPHKFIKRNIFKIPDHTITREYEEEDEGKITIVNCVAINPTQGKLMVTCKESQIYQATLWMQDSAITTAVESWFTEYGSALHNGPIGSMAVCNWKPILLTAGRNDRTLKIWNYETEELELMQKFQDDLYGVALHPSGLYAIVGFSDKLRFLTVMIEEFEMTREFNIRVCKMCVFSKMGYLFAAANGNVIQIYSTITFEMLYNLKGHNGRIFDMSWTADDRKMASCGSEGAVYEWVVQDSKRLSETIMKQCEFKGVAITTDGRSIFVVANDGHIRELMNSNVHRDVLVTTAGLDSMVLSKIDQMLFVSGNGGTVYNIKLPLLEKAEYHEYSIHADVVTQMLVSYDDKYLFTGSDEGTICFWKLLNTEGKAIKMDKDFQPSKDILISRQILEERIAQTKNLQMRLKELESEYAYQLRQNDVVNSLRMKEIHSGYCQAIEELKEKNEQLENDHVQEIHNINLDIKQMKLDHEEFVRELEANYNEKLIFEYEKYLRLEEKMEKMRRYYEKELDDLRKAKQESEEKITNGFLEKLEEKQMQFEELVEQTARKTKAHELIKQQIEEDADREIYELKAAHAKELKEEQELNVKIRGETAIVKKKLISSQKEIDELKSKVYTLDHDHAKLKKTIINLEKDIVDLKKEISERDATIQDKEKRIFDLKRKNQELEKFKFILDFKIKELKSQIEPREQMIQEQTEQINAMVKELENLQRVILSLDLQLHELREKLYASDSEVKKQIAKNAAMNRALKKIKTDIFLASGQIQNVPLLIKTVKEMYHKFNIDEDFELTQAEDTEVKSEFLRQREFLERTVSSLQMQVNKSTSTLSSDKVKLTEENAVLLVETNMLRKQLKDEQRRKDKLQSILGVNQKYLPPKVAMERVQNATATREEIRKEYKKTIEDNEKSMQALREENDRLLNKILVEASNTTEMSPGGELSIQDELNKTYNQ